MNLFSFDIETTDAGDSPGITCAGFAFSDSTGLGIGAAGARMTREEASDVLDRLLDYVARGYTLFTWNGVSFDLKVLGQEAGRQAEAASLALSANHVDGMLQFFCSQGFPASLANVSVGMGLPGKLEGVSGAEAPAMWARGEREKVLAYVERDAAAQLELALAVIGKGRLSWRTKKGVIRHLAPFEWLTVPDALRLPVRDNSWMDDPWPRERLTGWAQALV